MPFLIGSLSVIYYAPYLFFLLANSDMICLKTAVLGNEEPNKIVAYFFGCKTQRLLQIRVVSSIFVKNLYIIVNIATFIFLNSLLNGQFYGYGTKWVKWSQLSNSIAFDYMGKSDHPRPGRLPLLNIVNVNILIQK